MTLGDVLSHWVQFLKTARNLFTLMITRLRCSSSWKEWLALIPTSRSSPYTTLECFAQFANMCQVWHNPPKRRLIHASFSTWRMLCGMGTAEYILVSIRTDDMAVVVLVIASAESLPHSSWNSLSIWSWFVYHFTDIICLHWVWYSVLFCRQRQEDCMGHLECICTCHPSTLCLGFQANPAHNKYKNGIAPLEQLVCLLYDCISSQKCAN